MKTRDEEEAKELINWWKRFTQSILVMFYVAAFLFLYIVSKVGPGSISRVGEYSGTLIGLIMLLIVFFVFATYASHWCSYYTQEYERYIERTRK